MSPEIFPPRFLSRDYHGRFFPRVLWAHLRRKGTERQGTTFTSTMEMMICLAVSLILAVIGIPYAWNQGSIIGWILSILGVGGLLALVILSVASQWGNRPTYHDFLTGIFFFFLSLGLFLGVPVGMKHHSFWFGALVSFTGLVGGYLVGIFAGLWLQYLGWIAVVINMLAALAAFSLGGVGIVLLFGLII